MIFSLSGYSNSKNDSAFFRGFRVNIEQDAFLEIMGFRNLNSDQNYTQGFGATIITKPIKRVADFLLPIKDNENQFHSLTELTVQLSGFTPDSLKDSLPIIGDRPYSSFIWLGIKNSLLNKEKHTYLSKSFYFGIIGLDGPARNLQTKIHLINDPDDKKPAYVPKGWGNQISNGGEWIALYSQTKTKLIKKIGLSSKDNSQTNESNLQTITTFNYGFDIGYLTQLTSGISMKFGRLDLANWSSDLFNQLDKGAAISGNDKMKYFQMKRNYEFYFFSSLNPALTIYNESLHGGLSKTKYRLPWKQTGFLNAQARLGLGFTCPKVSVALYYAFKSPEMWNSYSRVHSWGGFSFTYFCNN